MRPVPTLRSYWQVEWKMECAKREFSTLPPLCQLRPLTSSPMLDVAGSKTWSSLRKPQPEKSLRGHGLHLNSIWFLSVLTSEKYRDEQEKIISYGHLHSDKGPCLPPGTITSVHLLLMDSNINSQEIQITIWFFFLKFVTRKLKFLYIFFVFIRK